MTERINARVDPELAQKLDEIRRATGKNTSMIIKEAIERYHATLPRDVATPGEALRRVGLIGAGEGDPDLSRDYKSILADLLADKT